MRVMIFIFNSLKNFKPVKRFQNRSDVLEFWSLDNSSRILDVLETIYLIFWKTIVQRVTVVSLECTMEVAIILAV